MVDKEGIDMDKKQENHKITSKEELIYNVTMFVVMLGIIGFFAELDKYKAKKDQQVQRQKVECITKTR